MPRSRIAGTYHLKNIWYHIILQGDYTILHFHHQYMSVPIPPSPCQHLALLAILILVILVGVQWYLIMSLNYKIFQVQNIHSCIQWIFAEGSQSPRHCACAMHSF